MQSFLNIYFPILLILPSLLDKYLTKHKLFRYIYLCIHTIVFIVLVIVFWMIFRETADPNQYINLIAALAFFSYPFFYILGLNIANAMWVYLSEFILAKIIAPIFLVVSIIIQLFFVDYLVRFNEISKIFYFVVGLIVLFCLALTIFGLLMNKNKAIKPDEFKVDVQDIEYSSREKILVVILILSLPLIGLLAYFFANGLWEMESFRKIYQILN